jgi:hypothetical protein
MVFEISLGPSLRALLSGEFPASPDVGVKVPDFVPEEWGEPTGEQFPG